MLFKQATWGTPIRHVFAFIVLVFAHEISPVMTCIWWCVPSSSFVAKKTFQALVKKSVFHSRTAIAFSDVNAQVGFTGLEFNRSFCCPGDHDLIALNSTSSWISQVPNIIPKSVSSNLFFLLMCRNVSL